MLGHISRIIPPWLSLWLILAAFSTLFIALVYGAVQQDFRQSANDPQIEMAENAAARILSGDSPTGIASEFKKVDIAQSLSPYLIFFDGEGTPIAGSGRLHGEIPKPPAGVFAFAEAYGEHRFTWQPESDVRSAVVLVPYRAGTSGFVMAGRSLREVEKREEKLGLQVFLAWFASLALSLMGAVFLGLYFKRD